MKNVTVITIHVKAVVGSTIDDCITEAIIICAQKGVNCILSHNGVKVKISLDKFKDAVYDNWDKKMTKKHKDE